MKIKFNTKINVWKLQKTDHLIAKKHREKKCTSQINLHMPPMLLMFCILVSCLSMQPSQQKKNMQLDSNLD
jgi:hypothetical protein